MFRVRVPTARVECDVLNPPFASQPAAALVTTPQTNLSLTTALIETIKEANLENTQAEHLLAKMSTLISHLTTMTETGDNLCIFCEARRPGTVDASTQTKCTEQIQADDNAFYFLQEFPPEGTRFLSDGSYVTPRGTHITRELREEFRNVRNLYQEKEIEGMLALALDEAEPSEAGPSNDPLHRISRY
jgi:hypothetical protein